MNRRKNLEIQTPWGSEEVQLEISNYVHNNCMYIGLCNKTDEGYEPYGDVTVNLRGSVPDYCGYVDINNMPELEKFITDNRLGEFVGLVGQSGYCTYPLYMFNVDRLRELCPDGMETYEANIGIARKPHKKDVVR